MNDYRVELRSGGTEIVDAVEVEVDIVEYNVKHLRAMLITGHLYLIGDVVSLRSDVLIGIARQSLGDEAGELRVSVERDSGERVYPRVRLGSCG